MDPSPGGGSSGPTQAKKMSDDPGQAFDLNSNAMLVGVLVGVLTLLLVFILTRKRTRGQKVLICGPCESGKTTLFAQLLHEKNVETYTSTKENSGVFISPGRTAVPVVDIPGHERLRVKYLEEYKNQIRAVIYMVDSSTLQKQLRDTAEYLFNIISHPVIHAKRPSILVLCNKQDLSLAKGPSVIQRELEKEMELLRGIHSRTLQGTNNQSTERAEIGKPGESFQFSHLPMKVEFCEASAQSHESLSELKKWLSQTA
eukprot:maker-scaffold43_size480169-snap-gene-1.19 protein:Tk12722 transcript:maker-scaffold43_size480169-snap-gene-1.19-mRNA-1 annotation:"hypothetical protein DAPPUDRAFT_205698"